MESSSGAERPSTVALSPLGPSERRFGWAIAIVAVCLGLAIVKPWAFGSPAAATDRNPEATSGAPAGQAIEVPVAPGMGTRAASASGVPSGAARGEHARGARGPAPLPAVSGGVPAASGGVPARSSVTPDPTDSVRCLAPDGWRLVTYEGDGDRDVRTWIVVQPVTATGPGEAAIPATLLSGPDVVGIGVCAPGTADGSGPWAHIAPRFSGLWRLSAAGSAAALPLRSLAPPIADDGQAASEPSPLGRLAVLYGPPQEEPTEPREPQVAQEPQGPPMGSQAAAVTGDWPAGRYVAAVLPPGTQVPLFFAFAITSQPAP